MLGESPKKWTVGLCDTRALKSRSRALRRNTSFSQRQVACSRPTRSGEADSSAQTIDAAAVSMKMPAGTRNSGDDEKMKAPDTISADTMKPLSEIMMLALVAASASSSISVRKALRNIVSTPLAVPIGAGGAATPASRAHSSFRALSLAAFLAAFFAFLASRSDKATASVVSVVSVVSVMAPLALPGPSSPVTGALSCASVSAGKALMPRVV